VRKKAIIIPSDCDADFVEDKLKIGFKDSVHVNKVLMLTAPLILYASWRFYRAKIQWNSLRL